jgi:DNA-binding Xre family transcriptional regulator
MEITSTKQILLKLKTIMLEKDIKKKELAEKLNISQAALTSRFKQENISINNLLELCDALNICLDINFSDKDKIT